MPSSSSSSSSSAPGIPVVDAVAFFKTVVDTMGQPVNTTFATTGLLDFTIGSVKLFVLQPSLDGPPWNLAGGSALLLMTDSNGTKYQFAGTINSGGGAQYAWTVAGPVGQWTRAWNVTDALGNVSVSLPIAFAVLSSPS